MCTMAPKNFFSELKRRNVIRAAILYVGAVWALAQGISQLGPSFGAPEWATRWFVVAAAIGFPFALVLSWFYEFTPEGLKRESEIDPGESISQKSVAVLPFENRSDEKQNEYFADGVQDEILTYLANIAD